MEESEDQRRHKIYLQINNQDPYGVEKLTTSQYVTLKHNDKAVHDFVWQLYESKKISIADGEITSLFRSIDDVDYTPIELPEKTKTASSAQVSQATIGSCSTVASDTENQPKLPVNSSSQSEFAVTSDTDNEDCWKKKSGTFKLYRQPPYGSLAKRECARRIAHLLFYPIVLQQALVNLHLYRETLKRNTCVIFFCQSY